MSSSEDLSRSGASRREGPSTKTGALRPALSKLKFCEPDVADPKEEAILSESDSSSEPTGEETETEDRGAEAGPAQDSARKSPPQIKENYGEEKARVPLKTRETHRRERRSWTDLDLSIVVALVSPVGQWLTGGDHVKNLLLIALLIFYLHQLIQVPWELYHSSLPRRAQVIRHKALDYEHGIVELARRQLRTHEFVYLAFSILAPFLGAMFLRYILATVSGGDQMSWFSTTLFVLATGIRPWSHLIARLESRVTELHDHIHYPSVDSAIILEESVQTLLERIEKLEHDLKHVRDRAAEVDGVEEVYEDLSDAVEDVDKRVRRNQKKADATRTAQEHRLAVVEKSLGILLEEKRRTQQYVPSPRPVEPSNSLFSSIVSDVTSMPHRIALLIFPSLFSRGIKTSYDIKDFSRGPLPVQRIPSPTSVSPRLETIPEDEGAENGDTSHDVDSNPLPRPPSAMSSVSSYPHSTVSAATSMSYSLVDFAALAVSWPYRLSVNILALPFNLFKRSS